MQGAYATTDARLTLAPRNSPWSVEFWVRNLFDRHAWSVLNNTTLQPGSISGYVIDPRSFGATARMNW
jgi:outer membrane receptor protein involved in Fe transport